VTGFFLGLETLDYPTLLLVEWIIVFVINVIPALAPPTWAVLSAFNIAAPHNILVLILVGVTASTCGRFVLARFSGIVTKEFASPKKKQEFNAIEKKLEGKGFRKFIFTFIYALSPLPSNALFIAFGATNTRLREVLAGFFLGRFISYLSLVFTTEKIFSSLESTLLGNASLWTIMIEVIGLIAIVLFFVTDWNKIIQIDFPEKKEKWPKKNK
jgi:membrane protein YqaA with SNARE-associated domain